MNHRWDYGHGHDRHSAKSRSCRRCRATGTRMTAGTAPWIGMLPGGMLYDSWDRTPPCPGTPWYRYVYSDNSVGWILPGAGDLKSQKVITPNAMTHYGREQMTASLAEQELPPLPEEAWKDAALCPAT